MKKSTLTPAEARDVQMYAAAAARRNRPTALLVTCGVLLVAAIIFAIASLVQSGAARLSVHRLANERAGVTAVADEIIALREEASEGQSDGRYKRELQLSKLEAINQQVRLPTAPTLSEQRPTRTIGSSIEKRRVDITMDNAPLDAALEWINAAQRAIPDLFVSAIELRPRPNGWLIRVQVARWELRS